MKTEYQDILFEVADYICTITINRPKVLNAFTGDTIKELENAILRTYEDKNIGVVVLTGAGDRAFSAGGFSHSTPLPALSARMAVSQWKAGGVATWTMSSSPAKPVPGSSLRWRP